jgi:pyruvyltransferase
MLPVRLAGLLKRTPQPAPSLAPAVYPRVELFHWSPPNGSINFGDRLSEVIVRQLLARYSLSLDHEVLQPARLLAIGSILHFARSGDHVWGSGWNGKIAVEQFRAKALTVHAVRGPLTAEFLRQRRIEVPEIFGDPAILLPTLFPQLPPAKVDQDYIFIPNLNDQASMEDHPALVSPLRGWNVVLERIRQSRLVLASSLHGLIVAEAYGVPARYVRLSDREDLFKYKDYWLGSGRPESAFEYASSIDEGLEMGGAPLPQNNPDRLLEAFPRLLWER